MNQGATNTMPSPETQAINPKPRSSSIESAPELGSGFVAAALALNTKLAPKV